MAKDKKYIITRSNYTVKKKHKTLDNNRTIYERDFMVTSLNDSWTSNGDTYGVSSFKMVRNVKNNGRYRYNTGEWLKQNTCEGNPEVWTSNCLYDNIKNSENNIQENPNYTSLLDFAYYRSCRDLILTSVNDIIKKFPAELFFTPNTYELDDDMIVYEIENPFFIELYNKNVDIENKKPHVLSENFDDYVIIRPDNSKTKITKIQINEFDRIGCAEEGDLLYEVTIKDDNGYDYIIDAYFLNESVTYTFEDEELINLRIRPTEEKIEDFFRNLDKFQRVMLSRDANPLYTMFLDFPHETDNGVETYKKRFTWPVTNEGGWNLDIIGGEYELYLNELLKLCDFYDTRRTNNLWRIMTHDSIKNMDYAFKDDKIEDDEYGLGESRFEKIIKCYAKQFDDVKQSIDNIKTVNKITYDINNNTPDYFLSDKLEMGGWEVYNLANSLNENSKITKSLIC